MRTPEWRHPRMAPPRASTMKLTRKLHKRITQLSNQHERTLLCHTHSHSHTLSPSCQIINRCTTTTAVRIIHPLRYLQLFSTGRLHELTPFLSDPVQSSTLRWSGHATVESSQHGSSSLRLCDMASWRRHKSSNATAALIEGHPDRKPRRDGCKVNSVNGHAVNPAFARQAPWVTHCLRHFRDWLHYECDRGMHIRMRKKSNFNNYF